MLMVIFGAGASYDSASSFRPEGYGRDGPCRWRPPLANELFIRLPEFRRHLERYPKCLPLVPRLEPPATGSLSLEEQLQRYEEDAKTDPERRRQLTAVQFYLRDLIANCQGQWLNFTNRVSNYTTLLDDIRRHSGACLVTFNYDTLLDRSLQDLGINIGSIENYLDGIFPLIKLHGSIEWEQWVAVKGRRSGELSPNELINYGELLKPVGDIKKSGTSPGIHSDVRLFPVPALAIPVVTKSTFSCPQSHLNRLGELIPSITKVLTIGWRGAEQHFLKMLSENLKTQVGGLVVGGTEEAGAETIEKLKNAGVSGDFAVFPGGFSDFIVDRRCETFLKA